MRTLKRMIIFFGPDGSGKTTQAMLLRRFLGASGFKVKVTRLRIHHSFAFLLMFFLRKVGFVPENLLFKGFSEETARKIGFLWSLIEVVSVVPWVILRVFLPRALGRIVICERYVIDTVVSIAFITRNPRFRNSLICKAVLTFMPHDSLNLYLTAEEHVLLERRRNEPVTYEFLKFLRSMYDYFAVRLEATVIDTTNIDEKSVHRIIRALVSSE